MNSRQFDLKNLAVLAILLAISFLMIGASTPYKAELNRRKICMTNELVNFRSNYCYAQDNQNQLPTLQPGKSMPWLFNIFYSDTDILISYGSQKATFYCPSATYKYLDNKFWRYSEGWNHLPIADNIPEPNALDRDSYYRVIGYSFLNIIRPPNSSMPSHWYDDQHHFKPGFHPLPTTFDVDNGSEQELIVDVVMSSGPPADDQDARARLNYFNVEGGAYALWGIRDQSNHRANNLDIPAGGNTAYLDGHIKWVNFGQGRCRDFDDHTDKMVLRTDYPYFWW